MEEIGTKTQAISPENLYFVSDLIQDNYDSKVAVMLLDPLAFSVSVPRYVQAHPHSCLLV